MVKKGANQSQIGNVLDRGVDEVIDRSRLKNRLKSGDVLRVKLGIDPTSPNFHLGHTIPLLKLRDFQLLGHRAILIIGNFTGLIGDTSDKEGERPMLSEGEIAENARTYVEQAGRIIDTDQADILYNADWLSQLDYRQIGRQANVFSINEFISRDNIARRLKAGQRVSLRETLYPLMQGYDSVHVQADVEIGGTDQRFNLLAGREMQRFYGQEPQDIVTGPLLEGLDGRKMSATFGNTVDLLDKPNDMFGKIMSLSDDLIIRYFVLLTRIDLAVVDGYRKDIENGANPRDLKLKLSFEIVRQYYSEIEAKKAEDYFIKTFSKKEIPSEIPEFKPKDYSLLSILVDSGLVSSRSEGRRIVGQGGVKINGQKIKNIEVMVDPGAVIQKGKLNFLKIL